MPVPDFPGTKPGLDVSHHNGVGDWSPAGLSFLLARATIGTKADDLYNQHITKARANDLVTGAYHFNWSPLPVEDQVKAFIAEAGNVRLYALDVEGHDPDQFTRGQAQRFIDRFRELAGKPIGLYMSESGFYKDVNADWRWVANWGPAGPATTPPSIAWQMWQYGNRGGEDGNLAKLNLLGPDTEGDVTPATITSEIPMLTDINIGDQFFDVDGKTPLVKSSVTTAGRPTPYGTVKHRAVYITVQGLRRVALVAPRNLKAPAVDDTPFSQADMDAAIAADRAKAKVEVVYE